jgi:sensor histidine kinase YesM
MKSVKRMSFSIRQQIFLAMTTTSLITLFLFAVFALPIAYNGMYTQLIESRVTNMNWLAIRLDITIHSYKNQFYEYEVDKDFRNVVLAWVSGAGLDHQGQAKIRTTFDRSLSVDTNIRSIEIHAFNSDESYISTRASAYLAKKDNPQDLWGQLNNPPQTGILFIKVKNEILILHQMNHFETGMPLAIIILRMEPAVFNNYITNIKVNDNEGVLLFNEQSRILFSDIPDMTKDYSEDIGSMLDKIKEKTPGSYIHNNNFIFYANPSGGKLQAVYIVPNNILTKTIERTLFAGIVISIIAVILALLLSLIFSRVISGPIIQLSEKMRTSTIKDYTNTAAAITSRNDEIRLLRDSFDMMIRRNQELIREEYQSKIEKRNAQIRALQAQINPHFIHNTLQVIGGMVLKKNSADVYTMVTALSDMLRYSFDFSREMEPLRNEIDYLDTYIVIQNNRFDGRVCFEKFISDDLMDILIPKLILQPIFENSFKHGFGEKPGKWILGLCVEKSGNENILIRSYDNGMGIQEEKLAAIRSDLKSGEISTLGTAEHIGLKNVNSRIRLRYGPSYGLSIDNVYGGGVTVEILIKSEWGGEA